MTPNLHKNLSVSSFCHIRSAQSLSRKDVSREVSEDFGMNMTEIRLLARERGINAAKMRKAELIRSIQIEEDNRPCYATDHVADCFQLECLWRNDCLNAGACNKNR